MGSTQGQAKQLARRNQITVKQNLQRWQISDRNPLRLRESEVVLGMLKRIDDIKTMQKLSPIFEKHLH